MMGDLGFYLGGFLSGAAAATLVFLFVLAFSSDRRRA